MIHPFEMPVLSSTMTEGKVVAWLKQVGDFVKANENIAVVESDKSDMEAECFHDGYLAAILVPAGGQAPTGQPIALIAETVEEMHQVQQNPQQYLAQLQTRAYLIHTVSLGTFRDLHRLPIWFRRWVKNRCFNAAKGFLQGLIREDVLMMEQEQQAHLTHPQTRGVEVNPVVGSVQKLIYQEAQIYNTKD